MAGELKRFSGNPSFTSDTVFETDVIPFTHNPGGSEDGDGKISFSEVRKFTTGEVSKKVEILENYKNTLDAKISDEASATNKLVDKNYVDKGIEDALGSITSFDIMICKDGLPDKEHGGERKGVLYFVPKTGRSTQDEYDEYVWNVEESVYEMIGSKSIDFSNCLQLDKTTLQTIKSPVTIEGKVTAADGLHIGDPESSSKLKTITFGDIDDGNTYVEIGELEQDQLSAYGANGVNIYDDINRVTLTATGDNKGIIIKSKASTDGDKENLISLDEGITVKSDGFNGISLNAGSGFVKVAQDDGEASTVVTNSQLIFDPATSTLTIKKL